MLLKLLISLISLASRVYTCKPRPPKPTLLMPVLYPKPIRHARDTPSQSASSAKRNYSHHVSCPKRRPETGRANFSVVPMLKPMLASQPRKDRNQDADNDEEAKRYHPYPQPIPFVLFSQPRLAVRKKGQYIVPPSNAGRRCGMVEGGRTSV